MSIAEGMPPVIRFPADPAFRESRDRDARSERLRNGAIAAAALAHVLVIAAVIVHWPALFPVKPLVPPPIPVTLVTMPPPPPKVQPAVRPPPPPPQHDLVSGADTKTTAPPPAAEKAEDAAPKPAPPPPAPTQAQATAPEEKPVPPKETHQAKPKVAEREAAPKPSRGAVHRAPGDRTREGDPYLNALFALIQSHRFYPPNAIGSLGLPLEGTAVYLIKIRSDGALMGVALEHSSGADVLDQAALKMIRESAPFPPPPQSEFPGASVVLEVTIHLFPGMG